MKTRISDFYCTYCGNKGLPINRVGRQREGGHLKNLFCLYCGEEHNHVEVCCQTNYTVNDFYLEFKNNNFKDGQRILTVNQLKAKIRGEL